MLPHTSNCLFLLCSFAKNKLPFQHIFVPLVEEESVSIMYDESSGIRSDSEVGSDSEVEYLRCPSCRKTH